jgi:hypothetical protein
MDKLLECPILRTSQNMCVERALSPRTFHRFPSQRPRRVVARSAGISDLPLAPKMPGRARL